MEWILWLECRDELRVLLQHDILRFERNTVNAGPEDVGLTLSDGQAVLRRIQTNLVSDQAKLESQKHSICQHCRERKAIKDYRSRKLQTLFGVVRIVCPRFWSCGCQCIRRRAEWPLRWLMPARSTPELSYLLAK